MTEHVLYIFTHNRIVADCWILPDLNHYLKVDKNIYLEINEKTFTLYKKRRHKEPLNLIQADRNDSDLQVANLKSNECHVMILLDCKCTKILDLVEILINDCKHFDNADLELVECGKFLSASLLQVYQKHHQISKSIPKIINDDLFNEIILWLHTPDELY